MTPIISIAIVDDHTLFRSGLAALLGEYSELKILFQAANGLELQQQIAFHPQVQVILMDINMPLMDGKDSTAWLKSNQPQIKVIALSTFSEEQEVIAMLRSGACGYLVKESDPQTVIQAIRAVQDHGIYLNEMVTGRLLHSVIQGSHNQRFSDRELEFLRQCCTEATYKEIASNMCVSIRTVDNYRDALFSKLQLKSRTGLVLYCIKNKLVVV